MPMTSKVAEDWTGFGTEQCGGVNSTYVIFRSVVICHNTWRIEVCINVV